MTNYEIIEACQRSEALYIGVMIDCAMDNAGFDGYNWQQLDAAQEAEIVRHVAAIVDGRMLDKMSDAEYATVQSWLDAK